MKPYDIYNLWVLFSAMLNDPAFSVKAKLEMGREFILALPPEMLCQAKLSLQVVSDAMEGRLKDLENERRITSGGDSSGATKAKAGGTPRPKKQEG